jgi:hypothetical protein
MLVPSSSEATYVRAIVSFIDVLGFRSLVDTRSPSSIRRTIYQLRTFTEPPYEDDILGGRDRSLISFAVSRSLSDAVIRIRPVLPTQRDGPVFWELTDLLHAQIDLISRGVLIRAGVTLGDIYLDDEEGGPIFGPAFNRAFEIESQEAVFPIIALDSVVLEALQDEPSLVAEGHDYAEERAHLEELLSRTDDGIFFLDYLRASESELDEGEIVVFLNQHKRLIEEGWRSAANPRVRRKYVWLQSYHNRFVQGYGGAKPGDRGGEAEEGDGDDPLPSSLVVRLG